MSLNNPLKLEDICSHDKCTGCYACVNVCNHSAIEITEDNLGFHYPKINLEICTRCNLCKNVCPANRPTLKEFPRKCYAFALKEPSELSKCASGGAATLFSGFFIKNGGVVYGCSGENIEYVHHIRVDSIKDLYKLQGSKYVQSDISDTLRKLKSDILSGKDVLFIGTPCQVAGVRKLFRNYPENLYTVDIVCHGVPSQKLLNDNINYYKQKYPSIQANSIKFRIKQNFKCTSAKIEYGWQFLYDKNREKFVKWHKNPYMLGFIEGLFFRTSCYTCDYAYSVRGSDITVSDFWGLGADAGFVNGRGVSAILVNSEKGEHLLDTLSVDLGSNIMFERSVQEAISGNGQLMCPFRKSVYVNQFREHYTNNGLKNTIWPLLKKRRVIIRIKELIKYLSRFY